MTHWRAPKDESHRYIVSLWPLAAGAVMVLAAAIFAAADMVGRLCR